MIRHTNACMNPISIERRTVTGQTPWCPSCGGQPNTSELAGPTITGTIRIDLTSPPPYEAGPKTNAVTRIGSTIGAAPPGSDLHLVVDRYDEQAANALRNWSGHLNTITIHAELPYITEAWIKTLRANRPQEGNAPW